VAIAAVLTLAVAVTVQVERNRPDEAVVASAPPEPQKEQPAERPLQAHPGAEQRGAVVGVERRKPAPQPMRTPPPFTPEPPAAAAPPATQAPQSADAVRELSKQAEAGNAAQGARSSELQRDARARSDVTQYGAVAALQLSPERWLEQIAELRKQGKDEEADKALAEFRKRYPDYRLTDEMRAKVEKK
jgi:hypothetical protein